MGMLSNDVVLSEDQPPQALPLCRRLASPALLDPGNVAVSPDTLSKAATAVGRQLHFEFI